MSAKAFIVSVTIKPPYMVQEEILKIFARKLKGKCDGSGTDLNTGIRDLNFEFKKEKNYIIFQTICLFIKKVKIVLAMTRESMTLREMAKDILEKPKRKKT